MIFSSTTNLKNNKNHKSQDLFQNPLNHDNSIRNSSSVSNNMKYSIIINSNEHEDKSLLSNIKKTIIKQSTSRTSSIASSFSDEYSEINLTEKQQKSKPHIKLIP
jgi:hypothetical protein